MRPSVVVVGGGLAGWSVAAALGDRARVTVLDRAPAPGSEASAHNAGMVRVLVDDPVERALAIRTASRLCEPGFAGCSRPVGALLGLVDERADLNDAVAGARAAGIEVVAALDPGQYAPIAEGARLGAAWWVPGARVADAWTLIAALRARAAAAFVAGAAVDALAVREGRCVGVIGADGSELRADAVVLAAGAWSGALAARSGLVRALLPVRRHLLQSAPHPASSPDHPWVWVDDLGVYLRPEAGGWLGSPCDESPEPPPGLTGLGPVDPVARASWVDKLEQVFPSLGPLRPVGGWTGLRTFAPDRRPLLGPDPEMPGLWWCAGLGGFGVSAGLAAGEAVGAWWAGSSVPWLGPRGVAPGRRMPRRWVVRPDGDAHHARIVSTETPGQAGTGLVSSERGES